MISNNQSEPKRDIALLIGAFHKLNSLQYLRGISALGVVLYHIERGANVYWNVNPPAKIFDWGQLGVPIFFCLSGFVITYSGYLRPKKPLHFLYSRCTRIYPAYLFTLLLFIVGYSILPAQAFRSAPEITWSRILKSLVFDFGGFDGYIYVGWTLFYEMVFYLAFALVSFRFSRFAKTSLFYYLIAAGISLCLFLSAPRVADFLIGVSIFLLTINPLEKGYRALPVVALGASLLASLVVSPVGVICGAFVFLLLIAERQWPFLFSSRKALILGDASYSIYLIQVLTLSISLKLAKLLTDHLPAGYDGFPSFYITALVLGLLSTILAGIIMRKMVEKPSFQWLMAPRFRP